MTVFRFTTANSVLVTGANQHAFDTDPAGPDTLIVDYNSALQAEGSMGDGALLGANGAWKATINGLVRSAQYDGLHLLDNNPAVSTISIGKTGNVLGSRYGLHIGSAATIVNAGNIEGNDTGIRLAGSGPHTIKNSGTIQNGQVRAIDSTGTSNDTLTNSGKILGEIQLYSGADRLTNSGHIGSDVDMGAGDDIVTNSKSIVGTLNLGFGHDKLTNSGTIGDNVYGGDGNDTIRNSGTMANDVILGDGLNTLINSGRIGDDVVGGLENDIVRNSGVIAGHVNLGAGDDIFIGGSRTEEVIDGAGSDIVKLGGGDDVYVAVRIGGVDGTDTIDGGAGYDTYVAALATSGVQINLDNKAHDFSPFAPGANLVIGNTAIGVDIAGAFKDTIKGFENAYGGNGADVIYGNAQRNILSGGGDSDFIAGYGGHDELDGGLGMDTLYGGSGKDLLTGGLDADVFWFVALTDSGVKDATRDIIMDFELGDKIDLSKIDANTKNGAVDDAFAFIGTNVAFNGAPGQLRAYWTTDGQIVEGDVNGDGKADFSIALYDPTHAITLTGNDFVL